MSKQDNQRLSIFDDDEPTEPSTEAAADAATDAGADPVDAEKTQVIPQLPADAAPAEEAEEPELPTEDRKNVG